MTEGTGVLTSPNYPHSWEEGGECDWVIVGARPCGYSFDNTVYICCNDTIGNLEMCGCKQYRLLIVSKKKGQLRKVSL